MAITARAGSEQAAGSQASGNQGKRRLLEKAAPETGPREETSSGRRGFDARSAILKTRPGLNGHLVKRKCPLRTPHKRALTAAQMPP